MDFALLAFGLLLIFLEFYLPGGIAAAAGVVLVIISVFVAAAGESTALEVVLFTVGAIVAVGLTVKLALWRLRNSDPEKGIYSFGDQEGFKASSFDLETIGKHGTVYSDLKPSGHVTIDNKRHQAIAETGYIEKGEQITVLKGRGAYLVVRRLDRTS